MAEKFAELLETATNRIRYVDKLVGQKISSIDSIMSLIVSYLESSETTKVLLEGVGSQIEGIGRADSKLLFGKEGFFKKKKKGVSLSDYFAIELKQVNGIINNLRTLMNQTNAELNYDSQIDGLLRKDSSLAHKEEHQENKRFSKKIKKIEGILSKADGQLRRDASDLKKELGIFSREISGYAVLNKLIYSSSKNIKGLSRFFVSRYYFKKVTRLVNLERVESVKLFRSTHKLLRVVRDEINRLSKIQDDLNECLKLSSRTRFSSFNSLAKDLISEKRHLKRLSRLDRVVKRFERRMGSISEIDSFHQEKQAETLNREIRDEDISLKKLGEEESNLETVERAFKNINAYVSKSVNFSLKLNHQLVYFLTYTNRAYIGISRFKRNPSAIVPYLQKLREFVERSVGNLLVNLEQEENSFKKEIENEEHLFKNFERLISELTRTTNKNLKVSLKKSIKNILKIKKSLHNNFEESIIKSRRQVKEEVKVSRIDRFVYRLSRRANLKSRGFLLQNSERGLLRDSKREQKDISEEVQKILSLKNTLDSDVSKIVDRLSIVQKNIPDFNILKNKTGFKKILSEFKESFSEDSKTLRSLSVVIEKYHSWLSDFFNTQSYIDFVNSLLNKSAFDKLFLKSLKNSFGLLSRNEKELVNLFEDLKKYLLELAEVDRLLKHFESTFSQFLVSDRSLLNSTLEEYRLISSELKEISKLERSITECISSLPLLESGIDLLDRNVTEIITIVKQARKKIRPEKILTQDIIKEK